MNTHEKLENAIASICPEGWVSTTPGGVPLYVYVNENVAMAERELPGGSRLTLKVKATEDVFWSWADAHGGDVKVYGVNEARRIAEEGETFHRVPGPSKSTPCYWLRDVEVREHLGEDYDQYRDQWLEWAGDYLSGAIGPYVVTVTVYHDGVELHASHLGGVEAATFDELLDAADSSGVVWEAVQEATDALVETTRKALLYGEEIIAALT